MTRYAALGNGTMLVDLDKSGLVRDLYFPFVGQENHANGNKQHIGVWVEGKFSWFEGKEWERSFTYEKETMVTNLVGKHRSLGIEMHFHDVTHHEHNLFIRAITIRNLSQQRREIRLFMHQRFECYESNIGDTVYYHPSLDAIIHYKGKRYLLINGMYKNRVTHGMSAYTTGIAGIFGWEGTYKDGEDGHLSGNPIEHGSVDSTIGFYLELPPGKAKTVYYWVAVGTEFQEVSQLNKHIKKEGPKKLIDETRVYWKKWVNRAKFNFMGLDEKEIDLFKQSLFFVRAHVDKHGSIIASSDSEMLFLRRDTYAYMWPRDGALIARSLDRAGYGEITEQFFKFCKNVLTNEGYLFHKYRPDGSLGSSWHSWIHNGKTQLPFQEDQVGLVLDALWKHFEQHADSDYAKEMLDSFIRKAADFLVSFRDESTGLPRESYDVWEEKVGVFTFTCSAVYAGLKAAGHFETELGTLEKAEHYYAIADEIKEAMLTHLYDDQEKCFIKGLYYKGTELLRDTTLDASSIYGVFHFKLLEPTDERIVYSFNHYKKRLHVPTSIGGYARYEGDRYHQVNPSLPGNPWFITTLWLAEYYIALATNQEEMLPAISLFKWVSRYALSTGALAEQLHPYIGAPLSATPLTWSHAAYIIAINKYLEKLDSLGICSMCNPPKYKKQ